MISLKNIKIHHTAEISDNAKIGDGTKIWNHCQIRENVVIGVNCSLGKDVYLDTNVEIGNNVKIQNGVSVYQGVRIEDDVFVGPHVVFTNDLYPRAFVSDFKIHKTLLQQGVSIGANSTIVCGISLGEYMMVGAGSVVTASFPQNTLVIGNPAKIIDFICKCGHKFKSFDNKDDKIFGKCTHCRSIYPLDKDVYHQIKK